MAIYARDFVFFWISCSDEDLLYLSIIFITVACLIFPSSFVTVRLANVSPVKPALGYGGMYPKSGPADSPI